MGNVFLNIISIAATTASICMLSSPILTVMNLARACSIGVMTITFFCAQYMNCVVWAMYGMQKMAIPVISCNLLGTCIATYCILTFLMVARVEEASGHPLKSTTYRQCLITAACTLTLGCVFLVIILILYNAVSPSVAATVNGLCGGCCSVIMLSSPLGMAKTIIQNKNAEGLQPVTLTFGTLNSILWTLYGILMGDFNIMVPNTVCTLACFFQFYLLLRYGRRPPAEVTVVESVAPVPILVK